MAKFDIPKGTRDFPPGAMEVKLAVIEKIQEVYRKYGYQMWEGPAFEYLKTLTLKSGPEVEKEIYSFQDKGGRNLGLRFELTSSLARIIANYKELKRPIKAFSIGKVWRYERPQQGRYREFYQADADLFGVSDVIGEVELFSMVAEVLNSLFFSDWKIYLNNRKILNGIALSLGIEEQSKRGDLFRSLDKLAKIGKEGVEKELEKKGFSAQILSSLWNIFSFEGDNLEKLNLLEEKISHSILQEGIKELREILKYWRELGKEEGRIEIDFSLMRGLDYYTGPIYEIKIESGVGVGSISSGGRYDDLVKLYGGEDIPAVGVSFGIERVIDLIEKSGELKKKIGIKSLDIFIVSFIKDKTKVFRLASQLREKGLRVDFDLLQRAFKKQLQYGLNKSPRYLLFVGDDELKKGVFPLKDVETEKQEEFPLDKIVDLCLK